MIKVSFFPPLFLQSLITLSVLSQWIEVTNNDGKFINIIYQSKNGKTKSEKVNLTDDFTNLHRIFYSYVFFGHNTKTEQKQLCYAYSISYL